MSRRRVRIKAADAGTPELLIYDEIGMFGVLAQDVVAALREAGNRKLLVRVNSPGGDLIEAVAIYNALRGHQGGVDTRIDALAASSASLIALAGDTITMAENALFMVHEPFALTVGTADDHRDTADLLEKVSASTLVPAYMQATGQKESAIRDWMSAETWFNADEALDAGFIDAIEAPSDVRARFDRERFQYRNAPAALVDEDGPRERDWEHALIAAGVPRRKAAAFVNAGKRVLDRPAPSEQYAELMPVLDQFLATMTLTGADPCPKT
jgi:ATP-dependent protease ClpP protease subunit